MKKETKTKLVNALFFIVCFLVVYFAHANADGTISKKLPPNYAHIASAAAILAAAAKGQYNLKINPDGTPAIVPYEGGPQTPIRPVNPTPPPSSTPTRPPTTGRSSS